MKTKVSLIYLLLLGDLLFAQNRYIKKGEKAHQTGKYEEAIELYLKAENKIKTPELYAKIARCYGLLKNPEKSLQYYEKCDLNDLNVSDLIIFADMTQFKEEYDHATQIYTKAKEKGSTDALLDIKLQSCRWAKENSSTSKDYNVSMLEINIKTNAFGATFYNEGIVFTTNQSNNDADLWTGDLFYCSFADEVIGKPTVFAAGLNSPQHDGAIAFTADQNTAYLTRTEADKNGNTHSIIAEAKRTGNDWNISGSLPFNSTKYSCAYPSVSPDGKTLYFSSDIQGGKGGFDLYLSEFIAGKWSAPRNLNELNTAGDDIYPHISEDGKLFFASNGHIGYGGYDVFYAVQSKKSWTNVTNLGKPVNTAQNDFGFTINQNANEQALLVSDRKRQTNIYFIKKSAGYETITSEFSETESNLDTDFDGVGKVIYPDDVAFKVQTILEKQNPVLTSNKPQETDPRYEGLIYKIQFKSSVKPLNELPVIEGYYAFRYVHDGLYRYTVGNFKDLESADKLKEKVRAQGWKDAFVVAFKDNKRVLLPIYKRDK